MHLISIISKTLYLYFRLFLKFNKVLSTGPLLDLTIKRGGKQIKLELDAAIYRNPHKKVLVTTGGDLPCKNIVHLNLSHDTHAGKHIVSESFHQTVSMNAESIAVPAFGKIF